MIIKLVVSVLFLTVSLATTTHANETISEGCKSVSEADVWLVKTGGLWKREKDYGHYRALVIRKGVEHAMDTVQLQITRVLDASDSREIIRCVDLESPGLKGYVKDVGISVIDTNRAAVHLDIEMKAMEEVVLREVYVVHATGKVHKIADAKYVDLYEN